VRKVGYSGPDSGDAVLAGAWYLPQSAAEAPEASYSPSATASSAAATVALLRRTSRFYDFRHLRRLVPRQDEKLLRVPADPFVV
jgi:hypothetical protein